MRKLTWCSSTNGRCANPTPGTYRSLKFAPSEWSWNPRMPRSPSPARRTTAPPASPNSTVRSRKRVRDLKAVDEPGALLPDVERGDVRHAHLVLEDGAAPGEVMVGRHRGEDDVVDLVLGDAGVLERLLRRAHTQVAGRGALLDVVACLHAAALADPGVGRIHDLGELVVGDEVLAGDEAASDDLAVH